MLGYTKSGRRQDLVKHVPARRLRNLPKLRRVRAQRKNEAKRNVPRRVRDPRSALGATQRISVVRRSGCSLFSCLYQSNNRSDLRAERTSGLALPARMPKILHTKDVTGKTRNKALRGGSYRHLTPYMNAAPSEGNKMLKRESSRATIPKLLVLIKQSNKKNRPLCINPPRRGI